MVLMSLSFQGVNPTNDELMSETSDVSLTARRNPAKTIRREASGEMTEKDEEEES